MINIKVELEIPDSRVNSFLDELYEYIDVEEGINDINSLLFNIEQQLLKFIGDNNG